jgi:hypothetical protein
MDTHKDNPEIEIFHPGFYSSVMRILKRISGWLNSFLSFTDEEQSASGINMNSEESEW